MLITIEMNSFGRVEEFRKIGCEVVAASTDSHFSHLAWVNTPRKQGGLGNMKIPLLADKTCDIAKRWAISFLFLFVFFYRVRIENLTRSIIQPPVNSFFFVPNQPKEYLQI